MNFNVVNALIYMLPDNQYLLQLFGIITVHANSLILRGLSQFYLPWLSKRQIPLSWLRFKNAQKSWFCKKKKKKQKKNFGDKTQFFVDDIYKISYQDNGITSRFMTLHAYKHKS